jgi:geranylgeranyl pyrophosphate synthase
VPGPRDHARAPSGVHAKNPLLDLLDRQLGGPHLEGHLADLGRSVPAEIWSRALVAPLQEFLGRAGKSFRAGMVSLSWALAGGQGSAPEALGLIVEYVHAGSLIIDDIQDGSLERRGAPSLHRIHGMPLALCLGNWLYFFPFTLLHDLGLDAGVELELHRRMTHAMLRCHYGQVLDLSVRSHAILQAQVPDVSQAIADCKTGTLFEFAAVCGAVPAGAGPERVQALIRFGAGLGRALQQLDDLGSLRCESRAGKRDEDLHGAKLTYAWALAAELLDASAFAALQERARRCEAQKEDAEGLARALIAAIGDEGDRRVRASLDEVLGELEAAVGPGAAVSAVRAEIDRLVRSYG